MPKISELTSATSVIGTEVLPIVQSSTTKKVTAESLVRKPVFEIDLTSADYNISSYGLYFITHGTDGDDPYYIILPDPSANEGMEIMIFNYDQTNNATFSGSYIPYLESSTSVADKFNYLLVKSSVLLVAINGYWNACNYRL